MDYITTSVSHTLPRQNHHARHARHWQSILEIHTFLLYIDCPYIRHVVFYLASTVFWIEPEVHYCEMARAYLRSLIPNTGSHWKNKCNIRYSNKYYNRFKWWMFKGVHTSSCQHQTNRYFNNCNTYHIELLVRLSVEYWRKTNTLNVCVLTLILSNWVFQWNS